ncbi:hypothetical protein [Rathayibacter iranicus]|uniref:Uncharacterized protein n=1 Tax=Rathayibacter iranicus TaxID=59737 RepID=A0AAD1AEP6_9MICO|nr:hypothetical protein [Rathayibacter iranicus]AZZ56853.1 hypothetical protein C7V51_13970 [Rathayibacter iranicus]MWV32042.1 hypothetical protein [Rathayibacter iranicus NCPPB 2253 = VKM Ac-1602]PPI42532.1 hypothetical protein C5E09_12825 [Rathayibacter iranicus]PPI57994.1 hypothetical protein C5E08_13730 [Rathayibacter iranicus]PPI68905.1 hypothetical protein C5E01_12780 [Rathayibacter iranicus]
MNDADALRLARSIIRTRAGRPSTGDTVYGIYVTVFVAGVVVFPIVRAAMIGLAMPRIVVFATENLTTERISIALAVITGLVFLLGRVRGPVVPSEPYIETIVVSPLPRSLTLRRPYTAGRMTLLAILLLLAVVLVGGAAIAAPADPLGILLFFVGFAAWAWLLSLAWLAGQWSGPRRRAVAVGLAIAIVIQAGIALLPAAAGSVSWISPWGWAASLWSALDGVTMAHGIAVALLVLALGSQLLLPAMLDQLGREDLADQARRWNAVFSLALTGDVKSAANRLKAPPRLGRHWHWPAPSGAAGAIVLRDLLGIARFPARGFVGLVTTVGLGATTTLGLREGEGAQLVTATAALSLYFAIGVWCEGLRLFGSTVGGSSPYGISSTMQAGLHLVVPILIGVPLASAGAVVVASGTVLPVIWTTLLAVFAVAVQAFSALKGALPVSLLTPVPSPIGDLSVVNVAVWLADAVTVMALVGGGLSVAVTVANRAIGAYFALAILCILMTWWAYGRLRRLARP